MSAMQMFAIGAGFDRALLETSDGGGTENTDASPVGVDGNGKAHANGGED